MIVAVEVTIKSRGLIKKQLKFEEVIDDNMRYGIMDDAWRLDEGKIGENTVVFHKNSICRGYEISIKKGEINLRMPLPTSYDDITYFYEYIKKLCTKMKTKIFIREGEKLTFDKINHCIDLDIEASKSALKNIEEDIDNGKYTSMYIFGAINPVAIGKKELEEISESPTKFGNLMHRLQSLDVYYAASAIYQRKDGTYFGIYVLTEGVDIVLPYKAKVLAIDSDIKVNDWNIGFVVEEKMEGFISYEDFLKSIKIERVYDSEHFIITLDKTKIKNLIKKYKVDL